MRQGGSEDVALTAVEHCYVLDGRIARPRLLQGPLPHGLSPDSTLVPRRLLKAGARGCHNQWLMERAFWLQPH